jgi:cold shock CspA family protein
VRSAARFAVGTGQVKLSFQFPEGAKVEYEPEQGEKGPQAANVVVVA